MQCLQQNFGGSSEPPLIFIQTPSFGVQGLKRLVGNG
jgi:hypothetical protein